MSMDWLKQLALGMLQTYIYDQAGDFLLWIKYLSKGKDWFDVDGSLTVPPEEMLDFAKTAVKALATVIRKGTPPTG